MATETHVDPIERSAVDLLEVARLACGAQCGVVRLEGHEPVVTDSAVPAIEKSLAARADAADPALTIFLATVPDGGFYAAARLIDSFGRLRGTFALLDYVPFTANRQRLLLAIASRLTHELEMTDALRAVRAEHEHLRPMIDAAPVAVFGYGIRSGRLSYVNAKFAETLGYTAAQILALPSVLDIIADDQREAIAEMIRRRESGDDRPARYVVKVRHRDGRLLDAEVHGSVAEVAGGGRVVIGAAVDVTLQMAANRQLRDREEYFRALADHLCDVIAIVDRDGVVTYVSPSVERILGHQPEQPISRLFTDAFHLHPDDRARLTTAFRDLADSDRFAPIECRLHHENGRWRTFEITGTNLFDNEQIRGFLLSLHDITDRKRLEQELAQLSRFNSLGRLAAQMAHEFNNVLMGIQPIVELIRRRTHDDAALLRFTDIIAASIDRGKRITSEILRFRRPAELALRSVAARDLIQQAADEIRPSLPDGVAFHLAVHREPLFVSADPAQLVQVLVNLALNAKDATEERGGTLSLAVRPAEEGEIANAERFVHFEVSDTGTGIAAEDLRHIFEPLFTTKECGTGLGLSVVLQIVAAHGGHISVDSEIGRGTTVHLFMPAASA